jgi:hypothetical protein
MTSPVLCAADDCERPRYARGYCTMHWQRLRNTGSVDLMRASTCIRCDETWHEPCRRGWVHKMCPACRETHYQCERCHVFLDRDSGRVTRRCQRCERDRKLLSLYGITLDELEAMIEFQGGGCSICRRPVDLTSAHVDHDHACCPGQRTCGKCLRGVLCYLCNVGIGNFLEDVDALLSAADYLRGHAVRPIAS